MAEITSAVAHDLPVVAIVLDNGAWGLVRAGRDARLGTRHCPVDRGKRFERGGNKSLFIHPTFL